VGGDDVGGGCDSGAELGGAGSSRALADEAAKYLAAAGRRASGRRDLHAATALLRRARSLAADGSPVERRLGLELSGVLISAGSVDEAAEVLRNVQMAAAAADDPVATAYARLRPATIVQP